MGSAEVQEINRRLQNLSLSRQDVAENPRVGGGGLQKLQAALVWLADQIGKGTIGGEAISIPTVFDQNPVMEYVDRRSYYPSLLYFPSGFSTPGGTFKYLCVTQYASGSTGLDLRGSDDFKTWTPVTALVGLTNPAHPFVVRTPGAPHAFRLYYWDTANLYTVASIRTAVSNDLVNWTSDQALANGAFPIITGVGGDWNRGSYGPSMVFYNPTASNPIPGPGVDPFDYSYTLYFDATTGGVQEIGLAYSADGVTFDLYGEVFKFAGAGNWDATHVATMRMIQLPDPDNRWLGFYSGGDGGVIDGVGLAVSVDRINWDRISLAYPLIGRKPLQWNEERAYAVGVLADFDSKFGSDGDSAEIKILVSGRSSAGIYSEGYFYWPSLFTTDINKVVIPGGVGG